MTGRSRNLIIIVLLTAVFVGGLLGAWWFRGISQKALTVAQIDRPALHAADPVGQWWTARDTRTALPEAASELLIFDAMVLPRLAPQVHELWGVVRRTEAMQLAQLPEPGGARQSSARLRAELQTLMPEFARLTAAYDLINAKHYRAAIDDWWAPYPQAQVFPTLAGSYRETLLAELPREDITPTHLQMGDVMAQRKRRLGWAAQAESDAIATALRARLDAERQVHEAQLEAELTMQLVAIEAEALTATEGANPTLPAILTARETLPPLTLARQFDDMVAIHAAQMPESTSRNLLAASAEEATALQYLWQSYTSLRERRIAAALQAQHLTEGSGPDMTQQVADQLFPQHASSAGSLSVPSATSGEGTTR